MVSSFQFKACIVLCLWSTVVGLAARGRWGFPLLASVQTQPLEKQADSPVSFSDRPVWAMRSLGKREDSIQAQSVELKVGDALPLQMVQHLVQASESGGGAPLIVPLMDLFVKKYVVVVTVPGAFTPITTNEHLPGFLELAEEFKARGVDDIICISVNDRFVMEAWGKSLDAAGKVP